MQCPRLSHFRRIQPNGQISLCGHMTQAPSFNTLTDLESSDWLKNIKTQMDQNLWPSECVRCKQEENLGQKSIRLHAIDRHKILNSYNGDYLIIGGILDNICNSACQFCNESLSTKIGSLKFGKNYQLVNNTDKFYSLPQDRIVELDINGGEPSNSNNYKRLLENLPENIRIIRINTNASRLVDNIEQILEKNIHVIVTISLDGVESIYEYVRWPLKWKTFNKVVDQYVNLRSKYSKLELNFWSTLNALTIGNIKQIDQFAIKTSIPISFGILKMPDALNIEYTNHLTTTAKNTIDSKFDYLLPAIAIKQNNQTALDAYIHKQDQLRKINFKDYFNEDCHNRSL